MGSCKKMVINGYIFDHVTKYFCRRIHFKLVRKRFCYKRVKKAAPRAYVISNRNGEEIVTVKNVYEKYLQEINQTD